MSNVSNKNVNIYIDQSSATQAFENLQKKADGFSSKIEKARDRQKQLNEEIKKVGPDGKGIEKLDAEYRKLEKDIAATTVKMTENAAAQNKIKQAIDSGLRPTFAQLNTQVSKLRNELKNMSEDAPGYAEKFVAFRKASNEINRLNQSMNAAEKAQRSWMNDAKTVAFGVVIGNTVQSAIASIGGYLSGILSGNAKLSDSLSDIEKSTGLSTEAVKELNSQLSKIDTRTKTADLREIAVGLGQIGEAANKANVEAIDKIVVALGDEFGGGAKEITTTLSVLRNNLQDIKTGDYATDVSHIGNALNTLGAEGLATAPVVTDIANRIAGIGQTFGLTSGQILGTAATFQELGIETERGSTAITKLFQKIGAEPEKFAKVAGIGVNQFKELINRDMLGAFDAVAAGAKKAGANNIVFSQILKELDADGSGAGEVLSKLGANHELLTKKVNTATDALKSNSSITEEFTKKNNNLAAELAKLNKDFESLIQSKSLADAFASGVRGVRHFIEAIKSVPQFLRENSTALTLLVAGIALLNASYIKSAFIIAQDTVARVANTVVTKAIAIANNIAIRSQMAYIIATELFTGKIKLAAAAQQFYAYVLTGSLGPIGAVIAVIGGLIILLNSLPAKLSAAEKAQKDYNEVTAEAAKNIITEKVELEALLKVAKDETKNKQEREKAIDAINAKMPDYIEKLTLENINTEKGAGLINQYVEALGKKALAQAYMSKLQDLYNKQIEIENSSLEDNVSWYNALYNQIKNGSNFSAAAVDNIQDGIKKRLESTNAIKEEIKLLKERFDLDLKNGKAVLDIPGTSTAKPKNLSATNPFGPSDADKKAQEERLRLREKYADLIQKLNEKVAKSEGDELDAAYAKINNQLEANIKLIDELLKKGAISAKESGGAIKLAVEAATKASDEAFQVFTDKLNKQRGTAVIIPIKGEVEEIDINKLIKNAQAAGDAMNASLARADKSKSDDKLRNGSPKERLNEQLRLLEQEKQQRLNVANITVSEITTIEQDFNEQSAELIKQKFNAQVQAIGELALQAVAILDQFNQARNNREKAALDRELRGNDAKKKSIETLYKQGVISRVEADKRIRQLDIDADKKKEDLEKKQFERNKRIQIAQALINGALAITAVFASRPGLADVFSLGVARAIMVGITVATTAAQIAAITSAKFGKGGRLNGPSHSNGGMPVINPNTGQKEAEVEGGEYILSKATVANNRSLADALLHSSMHNGGMSISHPQWKTREYKQIDFSGVTQSIRQLKYAEGGVFAKQAAGNNENSQSSTDLLNTLNTMMNVLQQVQASNIALQQQLQQPIKAVSSISLNQLDDAYKLRDDITKEAALNQ